MRKIVYSLSAFTIVLMLSTSFYITLFLLFSLNTMAGISVLAFFIFLTVYLLTDAEFIQDEVF